MPSRKIAGGHHVVVEFALRGHVVREVKHIHSIHMSLDVHFRRVIFHLSKRVAQKSKFYRTKGVTLIKLWTALLRAGYICRCHGGIDGMSKGCEFDFRNPPIGYVHLPANSG